MIADFKDSDGDIFQVETFGVGSGAAIDLSVHDGINVVTFYAEDAHRIIKLIEAAAEAAA
ncbi:hypothetical protein J2X12_002842 [Pseudarthrobacter oxydans]|uniref:Uncharacterized protein n=1 Tax=Pseudarthrobacter oxydans TaxID=1671 RepID=A0AAW8NEI8_PSEOX|nr:hypothetical protein [Pseudarthrobacter oxydans]MDR6794831.1 hypothetical protein [Pseudarthrobacter oxydans]MDR7164804.1 hypothetical protein [Pseudarthrobacter oxydans]